MSCVSHMMISRRRLTLARSFTLAVIILLVTLIILLSKNYPLDTIATLHAHLVGRFLYGSKPLSAASNEGFHRKKAKAFMPCKLHHLRTEKPAAQGEVQSAQCRRVQPIPGSCNVAEKLFHSSPPATCDTQSSVEICKLIVS